MIRDGLMLLVGVLLGVGLTLGALMVKRMGIFDVQPDRVVAYREVDGATLSLHMFKAHEPAEDTASPVLLLFHGGAWQTGGPRAFYPQCQYFAERGVTCISAEYRIRQRHGSEPADAVQDARAALAYVTDNAAQLGIDRQRIVAGGGSAGGHLAAALGTGIPLPFERDVPSVRPAALVLFNPMLDLAPGMPDHHLVGADWRQISPRQHVDSAIPPTLVLVGDRDREVSLTTVEAFSDAIKVQGGRCDLAIYAGAEHGFFNAGAENGRYFHATNERVYQFFMEIGLVPSDKLQDN